MINRIRNMETIQPRSSRHITNREKDVLEHPLVPALIIQSHPDLDMVGNICRMNSLNEGKEFALGRNNPSFINIQRGIETPLSDPYLSRTPIIFSLDKNGYVKLDCTGSSIQVSISNSLITSLVKFTNKQLVDGVVITLNSRMTFLLKLLSQNDSNERPGFNMVGISHGLAVVKKQLAHLTGVDEPVLIVGETGVGKELVAQAIYDVSSRAKLPFVKVNVGAIPNSLAAAELFGVKKGAFTGAEKDKAGYFMAANHGTLFLDEIGEASTEVQAMLLRVLDTGELYPVGSHTPIKIDVRIIAATDANLKKMCKDRLFKKPLLHRLSGYEIEIPSLVERREDIGLLFLHFIKQLNSEKPSKLSKSTSAESVPWISTKLMECLLNFSWPGNIRQLKNITRQLVIENRDSTLLMMSPKIYQQLTLSSCKVIPSEEIVIKKKRRKPNSVSREEIVTALAKNLWSVQATAEDLNISRTSIYELMKRYNLKGVADLTVNEIEATYFTEKKNVTHTALKLKVSKHALVRRLRELRLVNQSGQSI